jgi:peptide/nickel transport system substrate-binding protein
LVVSACSSSSGSTNNTSAGGGGGVLTMATATDITDTDSVQIRDTDDDLIMGSTVYESLFVSGPGGKMTPGLAQSATSSNDFKDWTFKLQPNVKFQDGKSFGASDIKANFAAVLDPKNASDNAGDFANVKDVKVISPLVADVQLKTPDNSFPGLLTDNFFIGDMTLRAKEGAKAYAQHPVGTGPYEWSSRTVGAQTVFKRFNGYWRGKPPLSEFIVKYIPDPTVATLQLEKGDVQLIDNYYSTAMASTLAKDKNIQLLHTPGTTISLAMLNFEKARKGGYKNALDFREGLTDLFDAPKVVPEVIGAYGEYADQQIPPFEAGYDKSIQPPTYDPTKDVKLLTEGGYPPGSTISIVVNTAPDLCDVATVVQANLKKLGYKVNLLCNGGNQENTALLGYKWDALLTKLNGSIAAPVYLHKRWSEALSLPLDDYYTIEDPTLEKIVETVPTESTPAATATEVMKAQEEIQKQYAMIPLFWSDTWMIASNKVQGLKNNLSPGSWNNILYNSYSKVSLSS